MNTPVLYIVFNRPDVTGESFKVLEQIKPKKLYIAADGPRAYKSNDDALCNAVKKIVENISWECVVNKLYQPINLGCGKAVSKAISWFFEHEEQGIILEDDIIADLSFFTFAEEMLEKYKTNSNVMHINGCNFQNGVKRGNGSYYFSALPHVWGWASWRRAWINYDFNLSDLNYFYNLKKINNYFQQKNIQQHWLEIFFKMNRKWIDTWDYQWNYAIWNSNGSVITPNTNLIKNIGFNSNATHTTDASSKFSNLITHKIENIAHPTAFRIDAEADFTTHQYCN